MPGSSGIRAALLAASGALCPSIALAQDRADDNAITQAEDAFGFSVGRESIGIYNAGQARGFSPTAAGNVRIDGLYFSPTFGLQNLLVDSVSVKVGLSAQGYAFVAPSGIVDQTLRRPGSKAGGSVIVNGDSWHGWGVELDGSVPASERLGFRFGLNVGSAEYPNGTDNRSHAESIIARWRPADNIEIVPFWARYDDYDDESGTFYIPAGSFLGIPARPRMDESPEWADLRFSATNAGVLASAGFGPNWIARFGAFRSAVDNKHIYTTLLVNQRPDGSGERVVIADPPSQNRALSGEFRVTHSIPDGPRLHVVHASVRKRDSRREFGGSDAISFGMGRLGEQVTAPKPEFSFGDQTHQRVKQMSYGLAYDGRWKDVGEVSVGLSRADYHKITDIPDVGAVEAVSTPWLYNGTAAVIISKAVSIYVGYARGLEESGTAPLSAANRNEPLETILTKQKDAGIRVALTKDLNAVFGVFSLTRPYFGFDSANVFRRIGSVKSQGAEFSVSGKVAPKVNLVLGGVLLKPRVEADADAQGNIGSKPVNLPAHIINLNGNWQTPLKGLQLDLGLSHRGRQAATTDNLVFFPARLNMNAGMRYGLDLAGKAATLRLQVTNVFDNNDPTGGGPGIYGPRDSRLALGYLTVDF